MIHPGSFQKERLEDSTMPPLVLVESERVISLLNWIKKYYRSDTTSEMDFEKDKIFSISNKSFSDS